MDLVFRILKLRLWGVLWHLLKMGSCSKSYSELLQVLRILICAFRWTQQIDGLYPLRSYFW
jgi:hypothetical protein